MLQCMKSGMDDQAVAQRVLDHIANGTTDLGDAVWREPVANYRSAERLRAETERVLRRTPTPYCPSAAFRRSVPTLRARRPAFPLSSCVAATARSRPSATPAGIAACKSRTAPAARAPLSAAITVGPTISRDGCATSHTKR